jgi:hypothetical protein
MDAPPPQMDTAAIEMDIAAINKVNTATIDGLLPQHGQLGTIRDDGTACRRMVLPP